MAKQAATLHNDGSRAGEKRYPSGIGTGRHQNIAIQGVDFVWMMYDTGSCFDLSRTATDSCEVAFCYFYLALAIKIVTLVYNAVGTNAFGWHRHLLKALVLFLAYRHE